jgi:hypothetical protein
MHFWISILTIFPSNRDDSLILSNHSKWFSFNLLKRLSYSETTICRLQNEKVLEDQLILLALNGQGTKSSSDLDQVQGWKQNRQTWAYTSHLFLSYTMGCQIQPLGYCTQVIIKGSLNPDTRGSRL